MIDEGTTTETEVCAPRRGTGRDDDVRCTCGRLLLRRTPTGLEIRCGRCKRQLNFTWEGTPLTG